MNGGGGAPAQQVVYGYSMGEGQKLTGMDNYQSWQFIMRGILVNEGLWKECTLENEAEANAEKQERAFFRIVFNVSPKLHPILWNVTGNKAKAAWDKLKSNYGNQTSAGKMDLLNRMFSLKQSDFHTVEEYLHEVTSTQEKLTELQKGLDDEIVAYRMLIGLSDEYQTLKITLGSLDKELTSEFVRNKILSCRNVSSEDSVLLVKGGNAKKKQHQKKEVNCYYCKGLGHYKSECPKLKQKNQQQPSTSGGGGDSKKKGNQSKKRQHHARLVEDEESEGETCDVAVHQEESESALSVNQETEEWLVDSGATKHMCKDKYSFVDMRPTRTKVSTANNQQEPCPGIGDVKLSLPGGEIKASDVLYVPGLTSNLLSVSAMVDKDFEVRFKKNACYVLDQKEEVVMTAPRVGNLFIARNVKNPENLALTAVSEEQDLWHRRYGHLSVSQMRKLSANVSGFELDTLSPMKCVTCLKGKMARAPFPPSESPRSDQLLALVHTDIMGPMNAGTFKGAKYVLLLVDDYSRKLFIRILHSKAQAFEMFKEWKVMVENQTGFKVKVLRSDNGGEFTSKAFGDFLASCGIVHQRTAAYSPQQNGVAERANRSVLEMTRCMIIDSCLDRRFWGEAAKCAVYVRNRSPSSVLEGKTPEELWTGRPVRVKHLRTFGSLAVVHIPKERRRKLDEKGKEMIFIGYCEQSKAWRFTDLDNPGRKVVVSRDAVILDQERNNVKKLTYVEPEPALLEVIHVIQHEPPSQSVVSDETNPNVDNLDANRVEREETAARRYPERRRVPKREDDFIYTFLAASSEGDDPLTVEDAMNLPEANEWRKAMDEEIQSLEAHGTWELVSRPENRNVISSKWVFKLKRDANGNPIRYKARLVARGFSQKHGIDYFETFSPTIRFSSFRLLLALAVKNDWSIEHVDIKTAFLNGKLEEEVYIEQPEGYSVGSEVCRLKKAIYGLKQAARSWYKTIEPALLAMGFKKSINEPCIFYKNWENQLVIVTVYVDDLLIFSTCKELTEEVRAALGKKFEVHSLGPLRSYLGIRFTRTEDALQLDQTAYIGDILRRFNMENCKAVSTPFDLSTKLVRPLTSITVPYQQLVGCLMYLAVATRPDLVHAVSILSQFNTCHAQEHWTAAKRVLRYLKGSSTLSLRYTKTGCDFAAFTDADWGSCTMDRRSYSGHVILLADGAISWESKKQSSVALSSVESEYVALVECTREALFLTSLWEEIQSEDHRPISILCDSQGAIAVCQREGPSKRLKHVDIRLHFVQDLVERGVIKIEYLPTGEMVADALTKPLPKPKHNACFLKMGVVPAVTL